METAVIDAKQMEALIEKSVQKHFKLAFENVEEVRKSPAVVLIRLEDRLSSLEKRIERDMVTRAEHANTRAELKNEIANTRVELKDEIAKSRADSKADNASLRTDLEKQINNLRIELKDENWKMRLMIIALAILVILNNPKVIELFGKLFTILKP